MNVNYEYYKIFYYVAKLESFTKAASALQNSQPNITRSIHNLESQLGVRLFQRSKKGTKLTLEGEKLYSHVKVAIESLQKGEKEILEEKNLEKGSITIGVSEIALHEILLPILSAFRKKYPGIAIHLINESTPSAMESLDRGQVDFALVSTPVQNNTYKTETISYFKEYVVASSMYEELKGRRVSMEELSNYPFVSLSKGSSTRSFYEELFERRGFRMNVHGSASTADQILPMIQAGLGIGFVPESLLNLSDSIFIVDVEEELEKRSICLVYDENSSYSLAGLALMDFIRDQA